MIAAAAGSYFLSLSLPPLLPRLRSICRDATAAFFRAALFSLRRLIFDGFRPLFFDFRFLHADGHCLIAAAPFYASFRISAFTPMPRRAAAAAAASRQPPLCFTLPPAYAATPPLIRAFRGRRHFDASCRPDTLFSDAIEAS